MKSIDSICPKIYGRYQFSFKENESKYRLDSLKTQYTYRFICYVDGESDFCLKDKVFRLSKGDLVFLTPADQYRILPVGKSFSIINVFFHFENLAQSYKELFGCVFMERFNKQLCLPKINFSDATMFNDCFVLKNVGVEDCFYKILSQSPDQKFSSLFYTTLIYRVISKIISTQVAQSPKTQQAEKIYKFINDNPCKNLCADGLQQLFGYHKNYLNAMLKEHVGKSLSECIRASKINYAKTLLYETDFSATQIAIELGYFDYSHFYKAFLAETGVSPKEFIKNKRIL